MSCKCIDRACAAVYCFVIVYIAGEVVEGLKTVHSSCLLSVDPVEQETIPAVQELLLSAK